MKHSGIKSTTRDMCKPMSKYMTSGDDVQITHVFQGKKKKKKLKVEKYIETFRISKAMRVGEFHIANSRYEIRSKVRMLFPTNMESAIK